MVGGASGRPGASGGEAFGGPPPPTPAPPPHLLLPPSSPRFPPQLGACVLTTRLQLRSQLEPETRPTCIVQVAKVWANASSATRGSTHTHPPFMVNIVHVYRTIKLYSVKWIYEVNAMVKKYANRPLVIH